jgi:hypothetical protein
MGNYSLLPMIADGFAWNNAPILNKLLFKDHPLTNSP